MNDYKLKKERQSNFRKLNTQLKNTEKEIEETELSISQIEEKLNNATYEELVKLTETLNELTDKRDALYEQWENISAELEEYEL